MNYDYKIFENQYRKEMEIFDETPLNKKELVDFPIEKSRMRNIWWNILIFVFAIVLYGFSLGLNTIAIPPVSQFSIAYSVTAVFSLNRALVIDLYPGASASATAVNNLMRCSVGAGGVAVVQLIIDAIGAGPTFLLFALITALLSSLLVLEWFFGLGWRLERQGTLARNEEARKLDMEKFGFGKWKWQN